MCGIAGFRSNQSDPRAILTQMLGQIVHRGPDEQGFFESNDFHCGMNRLSINDLDHGSQPLYNRDKSISLLYNGEIYNSPALRSQLELRGVQFRTRSDGEVICHLYEIYGENLFEHLDGMFAVALWIEPEQKLILARDIPGEKPLYYAQLPANELVFGSELKSLTKFPGLDLKLNYQAIWDLPTFLWIPEPETIYENISALPAKHILISTRDSIEVRPYENRFKSYGLGETEADTIAATRKVVVESVKSRLLSDVPLGCFLSSGLDSSIVTSIASKYVDNLSTFTIGFEDLSDPYHGKSDESAYAEKFAKQLGTRHHTIRVDANTFYNDLSDFCKYGDQPFAVSSGLGILSIAKASREQGIKVLLSGDGADECFGGYSWYEHLHRAQHSNQQRNLPKEDVSFQNFGLNLNERINYLSGYSAQKRAWAWHYYASENEKRQLFKDEPFRDTNSSLRHFNEFNPASNWSEEDYIRQDRLFYFPQEMLRKVDRMTMAYSIEGRVPFASPEILSFSEKLKYQHMVKGDTMKWGLRQAFVDDLPSYILNRPKHGFNVPIDHWLKDEWSDLLMHTFSSESAIYAKGLIHENSNKVANKMLNDKERLNGHSLLCFVMLNMWMENFNR